MKYNIIRTPILRSVGGCGSNIVTTALFRKDVVVSHSH